MGQYNDPYIYSHFGDNALIVPRTTSFLMPFTNRVSEWEEIMVGVAVSVVKNKGVTGGFNSEFAQADQSLSFGGNNDFLNRLCYGIKDSGRDYVDVGEIGSDFIGITNADEISGDSSILLNGGEVHVNMDSDDGLHIGYQVDAANSDFESGAQQFNFGSPSDMIGTEGYCSYWLLKTAVTNKGLVSQQVQVGFQEITGQTTSTRGNFISATKNFSADYETAVMDYNDGSAFDLPQALFIRWPFTRSVLRVHALFVKALVVTTT